MDVLLTDRLIQYLEYDMTDDYLWPQRGGTLNKRWQCRIGQHLMVFSTLPSRHVKCELTRVDSSFRTFLLQSTASRNGICNLDPLIPFSPWIGFFILFHLFFITAPCLRLHASVSLALRVCKVLQGYPNLPRSAHTHTPLWMLHEVMWLLSWYNLIVLHPPFEENSLFVTRANLPQGSCLKHD